MALIRRSATLPLYGGLPTLPVLMTLIAVHAVVYVSFDALVVRIRLRFRVAISALEDRVVV